MSIQATDSAEVKDPATRVPMFDDIEGESSSYASTNGSTYCAEDESKPLIPRTR